MHANIVQGFCDLFKNHLLIVVLMTNQKVQKIIPPNIP